MTQVTINNVLYTACREGQDIILIPEPDTHTMVMADGWRILVDEAGQYCSFTHQLHDMANSMLADFCKENFEHFKRIEL